MCRPLYHQAAGFCTRCQVRSVVIKEEQECYDGNDNTWRLKEGECRYGLAGTAPEFAPPVYDRYVVEGRALEATCIRCISERDWITYRRDFVDGHDDDLAVYLAEAPIQLPDEAWQGRQYNQDYLVKEVFPRDEQFSDDSDYDENNLAIYGGPQKLWQHRNTQETMEVRRSGRNLQGLQRTWPADPYNAILGDVDHPAFPYMDDGFCIADQTIFWHRPAYTPAASTESESEGESEAAEEQHEAEDEDEGDNEEDESSEDDVEMEDVDIEGGDDYDPDYDAFFEGADHHDALRNR